MSSRSSRSSSKIPFKSKKKLDLTPKSKNLPNPSSLSAPTPEKSVEPPRRSRRGFAFSIEEVKEAARSLREPREARVGADRVGTARKQILASPEKKPVARSKKDCDGGGSIELPEKYEVLGEFFDSLDSSIRLSRLKGSMPTFANICAKIETLTDRRFTYGNLAQLKFILPEAIELKKVLVFDEKTCCMKPDVHITLNVDAIEVDEKLKHQGKNIHLRKVFRERLLDFFKEHPEGDEVPEEELPVHFHRSKQSLPLDIAKSPNSTLQIKAPVDVPSERQPIVASHMSQSFRRRFSQRSSIPEEESSLQNLPNVTAVQPQPFPVPELDNTVTKEGNVDPSKPITTEKSLAFESPKKSLALETPKKSLAFETPKKSLAFETPKKQLLSIKSELSSPTSQATPSKLILSPAKLMTVTPTLPPPKRSFMTPESEPTSSSSKLIRRAPRTSLKFDTPMKSERVETETKEIGRSSFHDDVFDILPSNLIQSIREKERMIQEEQDPAISQAKRRKQMIDSLPKLFNMIHFLFQSINRSVITKEELIHKILVGHCDVVDKREIEEQLSLLMEIAPEWISEKSASSGDLLLCIKKTTSPQSIRARIEASK